MTAAHVQDSHLRQACHLARRHVQATWLRELILRQGGDLTGTAEGGQFEIELQELNNSGSEGRAVLRETGDGMTTVDVMLMQADGMATPQATPTS